MAWITIERPGYLGNKKGEFYDRCNKDYGFGNWRLAWKWNKGVILFDLACQLYEDAYFVDSYKRESLWAKLMQEAKDVYDMQESDTESGLDYFIQEGNATHLQDISIRRVAFRRGWQFKGDKLVQVRSHSEYWGENLSPGRVPFHVPENIVGCHLTGWWDFNSIEDFYQSNKVLQAKQ